MKLLNKNFALNQPGTIKIIPEEPDDLWVVYNLITNGDVVTAETTRKVCMKSTKSNPKRVRLTIPVKVTCCDFYKDSSNVRVHGRTMEDHKNIGLGSFHTLTLERNKPVELSKKIWDSFAVAALSEASKKSSGTDLKDNGERDMIKESRFQKLLDFLDNDSGRACYGAKHVEAAHEMAAIETLLITDDLYRSSDIETRVKYTNLATSVRKGRGEVLVYSSQQLAQLTGVAAILRFPLPYLDDVHF